MNAYCCLKRPISQVRSCSFRHALARARDSSLRGERQRTPTDEGLGLGARVPEANLGGGLRAFAGLAGRADRDERLRGLRP